MKAEDSELLKEFTPEQVVKLNEIIKKHKGKPGGLIPVLEEAQVALEYLPISVQKKIAQELNLPLSRVYGVVTFYSPRQAYSACLSGDGLLCSRR
jgi:NADH:ubiquinone oxidoreductase subunit E